MSQEKIKNIIEAALMVSTKPLSIAALSSLFAKEQILLPERDAICAALEALRQDYLGRGITLTEVASGFSFQTRDEYAAWINHLFDERPPRYSRALLETLAIIAYRQPITRGEIEEIRGVNISGTIIKTLFERAWIKGIGHREVPGKPELLVTTKAFLNYFNLQKLSDLPELADIKNLDAINSDLFEALEDTADTADVADTGAADTGADQAPPAADTGAADTGADQAPPAAADVADTGAADTGASDTGAADTGADRSPPAAAADVADTSAADTGAADTGAADTGAADTGAADTGAADTGAEQVASDLRRA